MTGGDIIQSTVIRTSLVTSTKRKDAVRILKNAPKMTINVQKKEKKQKKSR